MKFIEVKGAKAHNLKNVSLKIPRDKLTVITGLSGSGKSSLAFDTIYAEGQRRYVESLSTYARQFLSVMDKADIESIEGLSPSISIQQKSTSHNPRSTVGTITEIHDYLRLLFARVGIPKCPDHGLELDAKPVTVMVANVIQKELGNKISVFAPIVMDGKGEHVELLSQLMAEGFTKVSIDGEIYLKVSGTYVGGSENTIRARDIEVIEPSKMVEDLDTSPLRISVTEEKLDKKNLILLKELLEKYPGLSNVELEVHGEQNTKLLELKEIKVKKTNQLKNEINTLLTS